MPKVGNVLKHEQGSRKPQRQRALTVGYDDGWDLREVDSSFLVAELVRRGECPTVQPAECLNEVPVKPGKKPSLFG